MAYEDFLGGFVTCDCSGELHVFSLHNTSFFRRKTLFKDFSGSFLSLGEVATRVKENETYSVLLKDPKDSTYDIWYKVALFDGYAYAKFDYKKMDEEYVSTFNEMAFTEDYCKCDNMSDEMFKGFLE